ncbi:hypothetical protein HOP50_19g83910 [Chloropicon primus]|nr:hypothetical protein HOP50_19g83910 [Chloropicon primus]
MLRLHPLSRSLRCLESRIASITPSSRVLRMVSSFAAPSPPHGFQKRSSSGASSSSSSTVTRALSGEIEVEYCPRYDYVCEAIQREFPNRFTFSANPEEPRTGAFEVTLKPSSGDDDGGVLLWSKLQVGEPSSSEPNALKAVSRAILMELKTELNRR